MNHLETGEVVARLMKLFPLKGARSLSNEEMRLYADQVRRFPLAVALAAADAYKAETTRSRPVLGEFMKVLRRTNDRATAGAPMARADGFEGPSIESLVNQHRGAVARAAALYGAGSRHVEMAMEAARREFVSAGRLTEWPDAEAAIRGAVLA